MITTVDSASLFSSLGVDWRCVKLVCTVVQRAYLEALDEVPGVLYWNCALIRRSVAQFFSFSLPTFFGCHLEIHFARFGETTTHVMARAHWTGVACSLMSMVTHLQACVRHYLLVDFVAAPSRDRDLIRE